MDPLVSVIIPNYNREEIISLCIDAVGNSTYKHYEVIVVDDGSTDNSANVIGGKPVKLISLEQNSGPAVARNAGAREAVGDILLFIDSDILAKEDTISIVVKTFNEYPDIAAVVGMLDKNCPFGNLPSQHYNLRLHFNYLQMPDYISTTYTSVTAIRKDAFFEVGGFNEKLRSAEDPEIGFDLTSQGHKIMASKKLLVTHYKEMSLGGLLRNDVARTIDRVKLIVRKQKLKSVVAEKRFVSTPIAQIVSALTVPFLYVLAVSSLINPWFIVALVLGLVLFLALNLSYLLFIGREKGFLFAFKIYMLLLIDMTAVNIGWYVGLFKIAKGERH